MIASTVRERIDLLIQTLAEDQRQSLGARLKHAWVAVWEPRGARAAISVEDAARELPPQLGERLLRLRPICEQNGVVDFLSALEASDAIFEIAHAIDDLQSNKPNQHAARDAA